MQKKPKVLFLSTGNSTRSQMAEGFLRALAGDQFEIVSAGLQSSEEISGLALEVMAEVGIDISRQRPKDVKEMLSEHFGYVITLSDSARERAPVFPFTPHLLHWSVVAPSRAEGSPEQMRRKHREARDEIKAKVQQFVQDASDANKFRTVSAAHTGR